MGFTPRHVSFTLAALSTLALSVAACGVADDSQFGENHGMGGSADTAASSFGGTGNDGSQTGLGSSGLGTSNLAACVTSQVAAALAPVNLVFVFDKSGSMGDGARDFSCAGNVAGYCGAAKYNGAIVCTKNGGGQITITNGVAYQNGVACPRGTVDGVAAHLCGDVTACTMTDFHDPAKRWVPTTNALKNFFADAASTGLAASLQFFPKLKNDGNNYCATIDYMTPEVALTKLPNATAFAATIDAQSAAGGTPTDVALAGAYTEARAIKGSHPGENVAVVLVTDGYPNDCADGRTSTLDLVKTTAAAAASSASSPVKTYVIGIGAGLANLNDIAASGGTSAATLVSTSNPAQTTSDFQHALDVIRGNALPCDSALPTPPDGKQLDIDAVNVTLTTPSGSDTLAYNKACAGGTGWHYDNVATPQKVVLCDVSCSAVRQSAGSRMSIEFGCATKGGVIR